MLLIRTILLSLGLVVLVEAMTAHSAAIQSNEVDDSSVTAMISKTFGQGLFFNAR